MNHWYPSFFLVPACDVKLYGAEKKVQAPFVMGVMANLSGKLAFGPSCEIYYWGSNHSSRSVQAGRVIGGIG